ncbi:hypothetical protein BDZ94DRAFT_1305881 [Collybia nuda]|uniref:BTB domain-containing protein n=1 Tax=Collybia nuda TaxID=64659 RepID=A0A9P5YD25_9AGAR|nr:hypothetical protein BDZ94DRAFT_1305881 [Collybia nuda]
MFSSRSPNEPETKGPQSLDRSKTMWLDDGNIVLIAQNTQFRVHRSHPTTSGRGHGWVPNRARLDSPRDIEHFLNALYNRSYHTKPLVLDVFEAFLRLGHKYQVAHLRDDALACLAAEFPRTLKEWDDGPNTYTVLDISGENLPTLRLLRLVQELRLFKYTPIIYLTIAITTTLESLYKHVPHAISSDDFLRIALAAEKFREARRRVTFAWLNLLPCGSCSTTKACAVARKCTGSSYFFEYGGGPSGGLLNSPFVVLGQCGGKWFCKHCYAVARASHEAARALTWENLPVYCGLPKWDDLTNFE